MSRLIVKNLPNNVTQESLRDHFSQKGLVTDIQLKYTKDGKFRHFAFVGYRSEEEAKIALDYFNNTYIRSVKIQVQQCADIGDANKPQSWSKYAPDSSAYKKLHKDEIDAKRKAEKEAKKQEKKKEKYKNKTEEMIAEKMKKYKDDPMFMEYLEAHGKDASHILEKINGEENDSGVEDDAEGRTEESEQKEVTAATAEISDMEYLKLKMQSTKDENTKLKELVEQKNYENGTLKLFTIKVSELPYTSRKRDLKEFFKQSHPFSIRLPPKIKGIAYVSFKTEDNMRHALRKNKSFIGDKQVIVKEYIEKKEQEISYSDKYERWKQQEEALKKEEDIGESGRIYLRNLPYSITEEELEEMFSKFGPLTEVSLPVDRLTRRVKGFAFITFLMPEHAVQAYSQLDGTALHGRMLHLLPGKAKSSPHEDKEDGSKENTSYKKKKSQELKEKAGFAFNWNTLFLGQNAVADLIAQTYSTTKEKVLMGDDIAVRMALGETQIVSETREFLEDNGVKLEAFNQAPKLRSKTVILAKNLPANTTASEIHELFTKYGELGRLVLPPSGVTGIVEFLEPSEARSAFMNLAYKKFKNLPLYLEWAPDDTFTSPPTLKEVKNEDEEGAEIKLDIKKPTEEIDFEEEPEPDTTLFIKNLNFSTDEKAIEKHFSKCGKIASATVARMKDMSKPGSLLSMGYGFVQFYKKGSLNTALKSLQSSVLDGHTLELKRSNRTTNVKTDERKKVNVANQSSTKILVRNIPFQAKTKEVDQLFRTFGEINALRLPKKMVGTGSHRGFCFVEYLSKSDAKRAMKALCQSTHLYGRRLVLEWAQNDESVEELRKRTAKNFFTKEVTSHKRSKGTADLDIKDDEDDEEF